LYRHLPKVYDVDGPKKIAAKYFKQYVSQSTSNALFIVSTKLSIMCTKTVYITWRTGGAYGCVMPMARPTPT